MSLAEGGFQVGELAKVYYGIKGDADIDVLDYDEAVEKTKELFKNDTINIAEAAFCSGNLFVRADIIEKKGNEITLIEVKAKIWKSMVDDLSEDEATRLASDYGFTGGQIENISRKLDVDYILSGATPDIERIVSLCQAESIQKVTDYVHRKAEFYFRDYLEGVLSGFP